MFASRSLLFVFLAVCSTNPLSGEDVPHSADNWTMTVAADNMNSNSKEGLASPTLATVLTSTVAVVSAKISPTPSSFPETAKWNVTDDGYVCILLQSAIRIMFRYTVQETNETAKAFVDVPAHAAVDGVCGNENQVISLSFYDSWNLTFTFARNLTSYYMSMASLSYKLQHGHQPFPNAKDFSGSSVYNIDENGDFHTKIGTSSVCTSQSTVLDDADPDSVGLLRVDLYDTRLEAFRGNETNTDFSVMGNRCSNDEISLLIPIVVGACLAGLIAVVLVAYCIGRHRSKGGYRSVIIDA